jgi:hypothetical protein
VNFSEAFGLLTVDEGEESASQRASEWGTFKEWETLKGADAMEAPAPIRYKSSFGLSVLAKAAAAVRSEEVTGVISSDTAYGASGGGGGEGSKELSSAEQLLQHMRDIKEELLKSRPTTTAAATAAVPATAPASAGDLVSALKALGYAQPSLSRSDPVTVTGTVSVSDAVRQGVREGVRQALSKQQSAQDRPLSQSQSFSDNSYSDRSEIDLKRSRGRGRGEEKGRGKARDNSGDRQKERQKEKVYAEVTSRREQHSGRAGVGVGMDGPGSLQAAGPTGLLHARGNGRGLDRETDYADGKCIH